MHIIHDKKMPGSAATMSVVLLDIPAVGAAISEDDS
jgi:hypothetical protein